MNARPWTTRIEVATGEPADSSIRIRYESELLAKLVEFLVDQGKEILIHGVRRVVVK